MPYSSLSLEIQGLRRFCVPRHPAGELHLSGDVRRHLPPDPHQRAGFHQPGLYPHRPGQRPARGQRGVQARAEKRADPGHHHHRDAGARGHRRVAAGGAAVQHPRPGHPADHGAEQPGLHDCAELYAAHRPVHRCGKPGGGYRLWLYRSAHSNDQEITL